MSKTKNMSYAPIRFCIAGIICFFAAYLSEKTLGAVASIPFILVLPGIASLIYPVLLHITGFCALGAFIFKCVFSSEVSTILYFVIFCSVMGAVSALFFSGIRDVFSEKKKAKILILRSAALIILIVCYMNLYGTVFANLAAKEQNIEYLQTTYPEEELLIGSTYYSFADRCYVTEFGFTARERYSALVSVKEHTEEDFAAIDGYRDHAKYELLEKGKNAITTALSTFVYEGSDYVIRNKSLNTADVLTAASSYNDYKDKTDYEIALYYKFDSAEAFEDMCRSYTEHLAKYDSVIYNSITFYGFDTSDKKDFSYALTHEYGSDELASEKFDSSSYSRYFEEKDTHKYWKLLG